MEELKRRGFTDPTMRDWTFENDNGRNPQTGLARRYVEHWEDMRTDNIGCLFWGGVGTGKSYLAGCIANALMEKEIPVRMTNFALILNDLAASFEGRNEYISRLCRYPLLILDDFGMERGTEYGLEQVFNVIDSRYRSGKPLIVTTNLTLDDLHNPEDTAPVSYTHLVFKTITVDNGSEFSAFSQVESWGCAVYFAHPYTSWERPQNERHNGLFRAFVPKGVSMEAFSAEYIVAAADELNGRPRKKLGYRTPEELFDAFLDSVYAAEGCGSIAQDGSQRLPSWAML